MKYAITALALASAVAAAPAASCPILPASFEVSNFHFGGAYGPVVRELYTFDVKGNVGPSNTHCATASSGGDDKCFVAFRDVENQCTDKDFSFSFNGDDTTGFTLEVNYTLPNCGTLTGCRFFPARDIKCVDSGHNNVKYENLTAPTSFTLQASQNNKCEFH